MIKEIGCRQVQAECTLCEQQQVFRAEIVSIIAFILNPTVTVNHNKPVVNR